MTAIASVPREQKSLTAGMQSFTAQIRTWHERHGYDAWLTANALRNCGRVRIQTRLATLLLRGYVERERIPGTTGGPQFLYRYRLTAEGIAAVIRGRKSEVNWCVPDCPACDGGAGT